MIRYWTFWVDLSVEGSREIDGTTIMLTGRFETMGPIWNGRLVSNFKYVDSSCGYRLEVMLLPVTTSELNSVGLSLEAHMLHD